MKLKCITHKRRVVSGLNNWIHRNGDGSPCTDSKVVIGDKTIIHLGDGIVAWPRFSEHTTLSQAEKIQDTEGYLKLLGETYPKHGPYN